MDGSQNEPHFNATTDPKPPTDPRTPCAICGSTAHTTGYHDGGIAPEGLGKSGYDDGYHDGGSVGATMVMDAADFDGSHGEDPPQASERDLYSGRFPSRAQNERMPANVFDGRSKSRDQPSAESDVTSQSSLSPRVESTDLWPTSAINPHFFNNEKMSTQDRVPLAIYVSDERSHDAVEEALIELVSAVGIAVVAKGEPKTGSWSRWFVARRERKGVDSIDLAKRAVEMYVLDKEQAHIDHQQADAVAKLVSALGDTETALIQIGSLLLLKIDGRTVVRNLTQQEMILIRRRSADLSSPRLVLEALEEFACSDGQLVGHERVGISGPSEGAGGSQISSA